MRVLNVEAELIAWLKTHVQIPCVADVPAERPATFLSVERIGGPRDSVVRDRALVSIQCWAATRAKAADLAYEIDALLPDFAELPAISKLTRNGLMNLPDEKGTPRYIVTVEITTTH